ncbi:MAG: hypothetical protein NZZ41_00510 [Candidatus Dojkabacteria bacterium]|nr:hypothetical protein [Candidatus Dojkabacteria bacterium]
MKAKEIIYRHRTTLKENLYKIDMNLLNDDYFSEDNKKAYSRKIAKDNTNPYEKISDFYKSLKTLAGDKFIYIRTYFDWILDIYLKEDNLTYEEIKRKVIPLLSRYNYLLKTKSLEPQDERIQYIYKISDFYEMMKKYNSDSFEKGRQRIKEFLREFTLYEDNELLILRPKNINHLYYIFKNTQWDAFVYSRRISSLDKYPIYCIVLKDKNKKYFYEYNHDYFSDENKNTIDIKIFLQKYPKVSDVLSKYEEKIKKAKEEKKSFTDDEIENLKQLEIEHLLERGDISIENLVRVFEKTGSYEIGQVFSNMILSGKEMTPDDILIFLRMNLSNERFINFLRLHMTEKHLRKISDKIIHRMLLNDEIFKVIYEIVDFKFLDKFKEKLVEIIADDLSYKKSIQGNLEKIIFNFMNDEKFMRELIKRSPWYILDFFGSKGRYDLIEKFFTEKDIEKIIISNPKIILSMEHWMRPERETIIFSDKFKNIFEDAIRKYIMSNLTIKGKIPEIGKRKHDIDDMRKIYRDIFITKDFFRKDYGIY